MKNILKVKLQNTFVWIPYIPVYVYFKIPVRQIGNEVWQQQQSDQT